MKKSCQTRQFPVHPGAEATRRFIVVFLVLFVLIMAYSSEQSFARTCVMAPWPKGVTYRCNQGNFGDYSHDTPSTCYAWDFDLPIGSPVLAVADGHVHFAGNVPSDGYGNQLRIKHRDGTCSLFAHLSEYAVSIGQVVRQGQLIAFSGVSGNVTGPHLHFSFVDKADYSIPSEFCDIGIPEEGYYYTSQNQYR